MSLCQNINVYLYGCTSFGKIEVVKSSDPVLPPPGPRPDPPYSLRPSLGSEVIDSETQDCDTQVEQTSGTGIETCLPGRGQVTNSTRFVIRSTKRGWDGVSLECC